METEISEYMKEAWKIVNILENSDISLLTHETVFEYFCSLSILVNETGNFNTNISIKKKIVKLSTLVRFGELDGFDQHFFLESILRACDDLYGLDETDNKSDPNEKKKSEKRVLKVIEICRSSSPLVKLSTFDKMCILANANHRMGYYLRYKFRFDFLRKSIEYLGKSLKILRELRKYNHENNERIIQQVRIGLVSTHIKFCFLYELTAQEKDESFHGRKYRKLSPKEIRRRKRKGIPVTLSQTLTLKEIQDLSQKRCKIAQKMLSDVMRKENEVGGYPPEEMAKILTSFARIHYYHNNLKKSLEYSNSGIRLIHETFGHNHPSYLTGLYDIQAQVYAKMERFDLVDKMNEKMNRLECSGSNELNSLSPRILRKAETYIRKQAKRYKEKKKKKKKEDWARIQKFSRKCTSANCKLSEEKCKRLFKRCGRCQCAYYCSVECQKTDWKNGHKRTCKIYSAEKWG